MSAQVQSDQNKSRARPSLPGENCENIGRRKGQRASGILSHHTELSQGETWFPVLMGWIHFSLEFFEPNA